MDIDTCKQDKFFSSYRSESSNFMLKRERCSENLVWIPSIQILKHTAYKEHNSMGSLATLAKKFEYLFSTRMWSFCVEQ